MALNQDKPFQGPKRGIVYLIATPIGNVSDISIRAKEILSSADIIACEDTRMTSSLLGLLHIKANKLVSCYSQKEQEESLKLIKEVKEKNLVLAFVSDAGTPGISDPGAILVKNAIDNDVSVSSIPGPTAFTSALIMSGFDTADFSFYGFLPIKASARNSLLSELATRKETLIFYEAPHRLIKTLEYLKESFGDDRNICLARELTKAFEEYTRGTLKEVTETELTLKGEFVIVVEGYKEEKKELSEDEILIKAKKMIDQGLRKSEVAKIIASELNVNKNSIYSLIQKI